MATRATRSPMLARGAVLLLLVSACLVTWPHAALATIDCEPNHEGIFWSAANLGGSSISNAKGSYAQIRLTNRAPDPDCNAPDNFSGSTTHIRLDFSPNAWVEVGWQDNLSGTHEWFAEWGALGNVLSRPEGNFPCSLSVSQYGEFKIDHVNGTTTWRMRLRCPGETDYDLLATWTGSGFAVGTPQAETWRFTSNSGTDETGMFDIHDELQYRIDDTWFHWVNMVCQQDNVEEWNGKEGTSETDHYSTEAVTPDPTPSC